MVPFYCSSCVAGAIFRSLHHLRNDDSLCPPPPALPLLSLAPSLRMDRVFILLMSPTDLGVGFFYSLSVSAAVESDMCKDVMAPWNVTLKGNRSLWCCFPCLPFLKSQEQGGGCMFFPYFLRSPGEGLTMPRQYNGLFLVFKFRGGENLWAAWQWHWIQWAVPAWQGLQQALPSAPSLPIACLSRKM